MMPEAGNFAPPLTGLENIAAPPGPPPGGALHVEGTGSARPGLPGPPPRFGASTF